MQTRSWSWIFSATALFALVSCFGAAQPRVRTQRSNGCPVSIDELKIDHNIAYFWYFNTSTKDVEGVLFDAAYYDEQEVPHHIFVWGNYNERIHPGHFKEGALNIKFLRQAHYTGFALWPTKIRYRDGSTADVDPEAAACATERRGKREAAGVMPPLFKSSLFANNDIR